MPTADKNVQYLCTVRRENDNLCANLCLELLTHGSRHGFDERADAGIETRHRIERRELTALSDGYSIGGGRWQKSSN